MAILDIFRDHTGHDRPLGHVIPPGGPYRVRAAAKLAPLPESEWVEFDDQASMPIRDQNGKGACNGHAAATSLEYARHLSGQPHADLSPWFIYAILCGGIDRGSNIGDALTLLAKRGTCLFDSVAYGTINPSRIGSAAHTEAERFRVGIGSPLSTPQEIMTAVQRRQPFNFSVCVGSGFDQLDADGCVMPGRGPDNHAVCGTATAAKRCRDGVWAFLWQNSWSERWGLQGKAWMRLDRVARNPYFEGYTVLAVSEDPSDNQEPPIAS